MPPSKKVSLNKGKPFVFERVERVVIGPSEQAKNKYSDSKQTKVALQAAIDPAVLKMRVKRVILGPQCCVIIEGHSLDTVAIANNAYLGEAGLEVKPDLKIKPRPAIHDVPVELTADQIINCVVEQNLPDSSPSDYKAVYLYPLRNNNVSRTCIIEFKPEHRARLLSNKRIKINWLRCRISDHVSVLQCFKCYKFGHVVKSCTDAACCGKCAVTHKTNLCTSKDRSGRKCWQGMLKLLRG